MAYNTISQVDFGQAIAASDFTGDLFKGAILTGESVDLAGSAGGRIDAVVHTDAPAGISVRLVLKGVTKASAGDSVTAGDEIAVDANGQFVTATTSDIVVGKAITEAGAQGEIFTMYFYGADSYAAS
ncbi:MAG: hypothetical protein CMF22_10105 [Idiomarinaceae bacterium]|nr:hypothetical protein [Idiomarinaceae bacterium]MBG23794.1 hypothetical protein [Idiomarinaceae bacterium]|tara:strand:+ start:50577 stop:50957 length:381 start_codon:yes stop_codon:yes gene_type:complete